MNLLVSDRITGLGLYNNVTWCKELTAVALTCRTSLHVGVWTSGEGATLSIVGICPFIIYLRKSFANSESPQLNLMFLLKHVGSKWREHNNGGVWASLFGFQPCWCLPTKSIHFFLVFSSFGKSCIETPGVWLLFLQPMLSGPLAAQYLPPLCFEFAAFGFVFFIALASFISILLFLPERARGTSTTTDVTALMQYCFWPLRKCRRF